MNEIYPARSNFSEPIIGSTFDAFIDFIKNERKITNDESISIIKNNALEIVKRCLSDDSKIDKDIGQTVLHVGEVQSGKTLTMCSVIALAYDNNFLISTILTGTKNILKAQNQDRIKEVLNAIDPDNKKFSYYSFDPYTPNPQEDNQLRNQIKSLVKKKKFIKQNKMIVLCMLKHEKYINDISNLFFHKDLKVCNYPIKSLILDDEADQASLNTHAKKNTAPRSATNSSILNLKKSHTQFCTYIQVTATAQSILLQEKDDPLSPDFCWVSDTPPNYIGVRNYFVKKELRDKFVFDIEPDDIPDPSDNDADMPNSLKEAINYFIVACAIAENIQPNKRLKPPFTMLCHPDWSKQEHERYSAWISKYIEMLGISLLDDELEDEAFKDLEDSFKQAIKNLDRKIEFKEVKNTIGEIVEGGISQGISIINDSNPITGNLKDFWNKSNYHIIIGGNCIDRGFTVEGIIVFYLSRKPGVNSDTIQQRARFCGYKDKNHFALSRLFLDEKNKEFFYRYIVLEQTTRNQLKRHINEYKPQEKAGFVYPIIKPFRPTRSNVHQELNIASATDWFHPRNGQFLKKEEQKENLKLFHDLIGDFLPTFKKPENSFWRCFTSNCLNISDLKKIINRFHTFERELPIKNIYNCIMDEHPDDFKDDENILTCLMTDTALMQYSSLADYLKENSMEKLFIDRRFKYNTKYFPKTNLHRGKGIRKNGAHWIEDSSVYSNNKITLQLILVKYGLTQPPEFDENEEMHVKTKLLFNEEYTMAIMMRFPKLGNWNIFSK